jgi:LEA14-like dessication related protein
MMPIRKLLILALVVMLAGCAEVSKMAGEVLKDAPKPTVDLKDGRIVDLSADALTLELDVDVKNPYVVPLPLSRAEYGLSFAAGDDAKQALSGEIMEPGIIPARGTKQVSLPIKVRFQDLLSSAKGIKPGAVVPYRADIKLLADAPGSSTPLEFPLSHKGELPVPAPPTIDVENLEWKELSLRNAEGVLKLKVGNPNQFDVLLSNMDWKLDLNGSSIADGAISEPLKLAQDGKADLELPFSVSALDLGLSAFRMLSGGQASYDLSGSTGLETRFGDFTKDFAKSGSVNMSR